MKHTSSRKLATQSLEIVDRLKKLIENFDGGEKSETTFDSIKNKTIELGNSLKELNKNELRGIPHKAYNTINDLRNRFAHRKGTENFNIEEDYSIWKQKFTKAIPTLEKSLNQIASTYSKNTSKRRFEKSSTQTLGSEETKKRIVDAIEDSFDDNVPDANKSKYPTGSDIVKDTAEQFDKRYNQYLSSHEELSEDVQSEILKWSEETKEGVEFESSKQFASEKIFLDKLESLTPSEFFKNVSLFEKEYNDLNTVERFFSMTKYLKSLNGDLDKIESAEEKKKKKKTYQNSYFYALIKSLKESYHTRRSEFEQKSIDDLRKKFLEELYKKIENFQKLEQLLRPFVCDLGHGYLWDLSSSPFRNLGFDVLAKYSMLLNNDHALQEFAELLGRQSITSKEVEKKLIEETIISSTYHPKNAQHGNIVGFEYSNDINRVVPSETCLMNDPELEDLFYLKFAEKRLLSYSYSDNEYYTYSETRRKEIEESKEKDITGPIIICVDTSGSMHGTPEQTAKVATLAIAKSALKSHRKCYLISFSTDIETLDLSELNKSNTLDTLVKFLNKSFNGGTDAAPALSESLNQLKTENYKNADVLMISDFVMANIPQHISDAIKEEQSKGTSFYSIVIGESANKSTIESFDENIMYNPYNELSRQEFHRKIRDLSTRINQNSPRKHGKENYLTE